MSNTFILAAGVICFGLTLIGVILTVYEFKNLARASAKGLASVEPLPMTMVELAEQRSRAS